MKRPDLKSHFHRIFSVGVVCLPVVELYRTFFGGALELCGFALEEIILLLWAGSVFFYGLMLALRSKNKIPLIATAVWLGISLLYLLLHGANAARFDASLLPGSKPHFLTECYYVVRTWLAPTAVLLGAWLGKLPRNTLFSALRGALWVVSFGVVIPCVFGFSLSSYLEGDQFIAGGFFSWFSLPEGADPAAYTARGLFPRANVVGAVLFGLVPLAAYSALKRGKITDYLLLFFTGLASVMVGTKIGSLGFFLGLVATLVVALLQRFICKKEEPSNRNLALSFLILALILPLFLISPGRALQARREDQKESDLRTLALTAEVEAVLEKSRENLALTEEDTSLIAAYLKEHRWDHFIDPWFPALYPPEGDATFWCRILSRDPRENQDARRFKIELCRRIAERNENELDPLFGMGYTSGIPYTERDLVFQYYELGAAGVLVLMGPYFALFLYGCAQALKALFCRRSLLITGALTLSLFSLFATAYLAGHVFDTVLSTYVVALIGALFPAGGLDEA
ncbi:MAG: O-antigen ligase family protein [Clostridia bacterium]|nr:O-antigen ligase family protein [Clostridia bacterium]